MIVGKKDAPLFEAELQAGVKADPQGKSDSKKDESHLPTFIVHASIDVVEETVWKNSNMYGRNRWYRTLTESESGKLLLFEKLTSSLTLPFSRR